MEAVRVAISDGVLTFMCVFCASTLGVATSVIATAVGFQGMALLLVTTALLFILLLIFGIIGDAIGGASFNPTGTVAFYAADLGRDTLISTAVRFPAQAGEKRKEEETIELKGPLGKSNAVNSELVPIERDLVAVRKNGSIDPFGLYLYGLVLNAKGNENLARSILVESVNAYPWNWRAWLELQSLCTTIDTLNSLKLNNHWMKDFFLASTYHELRMHRESLAKYDYLQATFGCSNYIKAQIAKAQYSLCDFELVEAIFEELLRIDPYHIDDIDMYSNVLYAKECFSGLSYLAHQVFMTDKYRPESCCIIGNYYSLKGLHEKSVMYFRRALKLDKKYLSAWTLMGHEYVEMKNTPVAVDAYRWVVDITHVTIGLGTGKGKLMK